MLQIGGSIIIMYRYNYAQSKLGLMNRRRNVELEMRDRVHSSGTNTPRKPMINRKALLAHDRRYWRLRRAQDIFFSGLALLVLSPVMLLVALIIYIDSPGASPIFVQDRVGRNGKIFRFLNLRWMKPRCMVHKEMCCFSDYICAV